MKTRPKLLDLFCGAGGCAVGYHRAGFDVTGVDISPQSNYPFKFIQADALNFDVSGYDVIHASPPCQHDSCALNLNRRARALRASKHRRMIEPVREKLRAARVPYVIENVPGAPLRWPITLCGTMFGLRVFRHRLFESNIVLLSCTHPPHRGTVQDGDFVTVAGMGGRMKKRDGTYRECSRDTDVWRAAMGIDWMSRYELTQAIPPAYTEHIGQQLIRVLS